MSEAVKNILKKIVPKSIRRMIVSYRYGFFGPYPSWEVARKKTSGYDQAEILSKVENAILKVKNGEVAYERDSVTFGKPEYSWFILATLLYIAGTESGKLRVADFGGSLGSTYFQNRLFLKNLSELSWNVIEQPHFVESGKRLVADTRLHFFNSLGECVQEENPHTLMFGSSIQYFEEPYELLEKVVKDFSFGYLIFDRTPLTEGVNDIVVVQKVPPQVYEASYPCWFLSKEKLIAFLSSTYELVAEAEALGGEIKQRNIAGKYTGLLFKRKV